MRGIQKSCAFTGHRPKKLPWHYNEDDARCVSLKATLAAEIAHLAEDGVTQYLSGMAEGTDIWCALAVLALREKNSAIKLHCILPCVSQAEQWKTPSRELYYSILNQADSVVYVSREAHKNCMLERNHFLVEYADLLLAVYNGEPRGGTAATVRYARKKGIEVRAIDPLTQQVIIEDSTQEKL